MLTGAAGTMVLQAARDRPVHGPAPGSALDNAVIESWHSTLEFELRSPHSSAARAEARATVAAWFEDSNHLRRHYARAGQKEAAAPPQSFSRR
jgi:transposase InsO family protein